MIRSLYPSHQPTGRSSKQALPGQVDHSVRRLDFEGAKRYALERLERGLEPRLFYHSLGHTRDDVVPAIERLAAIIGVDAEGRLLLRTAAYFHDIGFVERRADHEQASARIAAEALPVFGYGPEQIATIRGIIMATKLPQSPRTLLEAIMADADLDGLGREDFWTKSHALRVELAAYGTTYTDQEWYDNQLAFVQSHRYFTSAARALRAAQQQQHIGELAALAAR
jgi:uncharacterized protein